MKITHVASLGTDYTVSDPQGNVIKTIQIIPQTEILNATLGKYDPNIGSYSDYLGESIATLTGFESIDPTKIMWYATEDDEVVLIEIIEYAVKHGYDKIILEHLDHVE